MKKNVASNDFWQFTRKGWTVLFLVLIGSLCCSNLAAQNLTVKGSVKSASNEPVPGAAVLVKGTTNGTAADESGNYSLTNVPANATLIFSFIGMEKQEVNVAGKKQIDIVLNDEVISLNEVVAIGYGTVKKKDLTGALSTLGGEKLTSRQTPQVMTAMQGAMPGVTITRSTSAPGASGTIRVRGITSMLESDPLIIVDGVPVSSINDVNPNDIETITVLKDAASASIYGARAAAGVVLINTKRTSKKGASIDYSYNLSMDMPTKMPEYADAVTYMKVFNERTWNDYASNGEFSDYSEELINNYWTLNADNPDLYPNTDWVDLCLKDYALRNSHNLSISTGSEYSKTKVSLGYDDVESLFKANNSWDRVTVRVNNDLQIKKWLSASVDLGLRRAVGITPAFSPSLRMRYTAPIYAAVYSDGRLAGGKDGENPYAKMMYGGQDKDTNSKMNGKFSLNVTPFKSLVITGVFAPNYSFTKTKDFSKQVQYYKTPELDSEKLYMDGTDKTNLSEKRSDNYSITSQVFANYTKSFGDHNLNAMVGFESYYYFAESLSAGRKEYDFTYYPYLSAGPTTIVTNDGDAFENAYDSYFGRLMYNYKSRYYLQANIRRDGSSRFAKEYRWGSFPSVSAGWVLSQEEFMKDIDWLSNFKVRASWGQLGNERITGNYPYQSTLEFNYPTLYVNNVTTPVQGASAYKYPVYDISWETTETSDIGLDLGLFNNRLRLTGDYYWKTTKDMLLKLEIPDFLGYTDPEQNGGTMSTKGWDIELGWNDRIGKLGYAVSFNISDYKSVMGNLKGTHIQTSDGYMTREGSEFQEWYGFVSDGLYQSADELVGSPVLTSKVEAGDIRYKDISGAEGVPDGKITPDYDKVLLGGSLPRYNYGGTINLDYMGFDFMLGFQGVGKKNSMLTSDMVLPLRGDTYNVPEIILGNHWSKYNSDAQNLNAKYPRISRFGEANNYVISDFWMIDGSYFRIKNITFGYTVPSNVIEKLGIQNLRLSFSMQDFFTFSHFPTGWDPEVSTSGYPITKSVVFGASIKF